MLARISPTVSFAICHYHPSLLEGPLNYILCPYRAVVDKFLSVFQHLHVNVKGSIGERHIWFCFYFSSSVPISCPSSLDRFRDGIRWPYSFCFMRCCFKVLYNIARGILWQFPSSFFSRRLVNVHVVHPYSRIDTTAAFIILLIEFFTSALADGLSLESEWQQVSSSLQDSSRDSGRSQQCCVLDSLYPSANFQDFQAFS